MNYIGAFVKQLPSGGYKAYIWGQPDMHIMDWNGPNYRRKTIPDQPLFGHKTEQETVDFVLSTYPQEVNLREWAQHRRTGDGTSLTNEFFKEVLDIKWKKKDMI